MLLPVLFFVLSMLKVAAVRNIADGLNDSQSEGSAQEEEDDEEEEEEDSDDNEEGEGGNKTASRRVSWLKRGKVAPYEPDEESGEEDSGGESGEASGEEESGEDDEDGEVGVAGFFKVLFFTHAAVREGDA